MGRRYRGIRRRRAEKGGLPYKLEGEVFIIGGANEKLWGKQLLRGKKT